MDYIKQNRFLITVIVILVALNVATIIYTLTGHHWKIDMGEKKRDMVAHFIEDELNLDSTQKAQYSILRSSHFMMGDSLMHRQMTAMRVLFDMVSVDPVDSLRLQQVVGTLSQVEHDRAMESFEHFRGIRHLCTPQQKVKFDTLVTNVLLKAGIPGPGGPGHGPEGKENR